MTEPRVRSVAERSLQPEGSGKGFPSPGGRPARAARLSRALAAALAISLSWVAPGAGGLPSSARADDAPAVGAALVEARFTDHCLEQPVEAEALYQHALESGKLTPREKAEARYSIARGRAIDGRRESASALLETLARETGNAALGTWPARARRALDALSAGLDPFAPEARGEGVHTVEATAKTLTAVLRELGAQKSLSFALDGSCPETWTVSAYLRDQSLTDLLDKLVGKGRWRRCGDGAFALGDCASDGEAWERPVPWAKVEEPADRANGARICATRVSLTLAGTPLSQAGATIEKLGIAKVVLAEGVRGGRPVRVFAKDLRLDRALDLLCVPLGYEWVLEEGAITVRPRSKKEE